MRLAFGCQSRVGKDTAVDYIRGKYPCQVVRFASPLYDIMYHTQSELGFSYDKDPQFLQLVGTWARNKDPNVWINLALNQIYSSSSEHLLVPDLRFQNEYRALKRVGFIMIRIVRPDRLVDRDPDHPSEQELAGPEIEWDYTITNEGTVEDFKVKLDLLLNHIKGSF